MKGHQYDDKKGMFMTKTMDFKTYLFSSKTVEIETLEITP